MGDEKEGMKRGDKKQVRIWGDEKKGEKRRKGE